MTEAQLTQLAKLEQLTPGWRDGEDIELAPQSIAHTRSFLQRAHDQQLKAFPTLEGGITIERHSVSGRWSLEIEADGAYTMIEIIFGSEPVVLEHISEEAALESLRRLA